METEIKHQIFVVGSPRSGTSIIGSSLRTALGINSKYSEFHLLPLYFKLIKGVEEYFSLPATIESSKIEGMLLKDVSKEFVYRRVRRIMRALYNEALEDTNFVDKTPGTEMIKSVPELIKIWPDAKIVYAKRRGIENIISRQSKFKHVSFENHCRQWSSSMQFWNNAKQRLAALSKEENFIEIDQYEIANRPSEVASKLSSFIGLDEQGTKSLLNSFTKRSPEKTSDNYDAVDITNCGWSDEMIALFNEIAGNAMKNNGYSFTSSYYLK